MADPDDVRRALGLKPRSPSEGAEAKTEDVPAPAVKAGEGEVIPGLGIKRRSAPGGTDDGPARGAPGSEGASEARAPKVRLRESAPPADAEPPPERDPARKPVGKKLPIEAQQLLRNYYHLRPAVDLPPFLFELDGTWGRYAGDGKPEREIKLGFRPAFVLFTVPCYPDEQPKWTKAGFVEPGLHDQPETSEKGFRVGERLNRLGDWVVYLAWKDDGRLAEAREKEKAAAAQAAAAPRAGENDRDARRREERERRERDLEERRARDRERRAR